MNDVERAFVDGIMKDRHKMLDLISELPMAMSMSERVDRLSAKQVEGGFELTVVMADIFVAGRERNAGTFKVGPDGAPVD